MNKDDYPRCKTCRHYVHKYGDNGTCFLASEDNQDRHMSLASAQGYERSELVVYETFGCIQHEPKEATEQEKTDVRQQF